jgi:tetratricopeptide (TPR) repeat protein
VAHPVANLATMYLEEGKRDDAVAACDRSLKIAPNEGAYLLLGDMAFTDGRYSAALDNYRRAAALMPGDHLAWRNIGDSYAMLGDRAMVKKYYARAAGLVANFVAANPRAGTRWATLAFYDAKLGNRELAEADMARAKELGVNDVDSRFMFVQALALLGKKEQALQLLLTCIDNGLAPINVDLALDLASLRKDPRYLSHIAKLRSPKTFSPS